MVDNMITFNTVSNKVYDILTKRGYEPVRGEDGIECSVGGVKLSFYLIEDDVFGYSAEFKLQRELSDEEKSEISEAYLKTEIDDVAFENLHIDGEIAYLSSAFFLDMYDDGMVELAVKMLEEKGGAVDLLKSKQVVGES